MASIWDNYYRGLQHLSYFLAHLQTDAVGFRYPHHPERLNVSPAPLCGLKNGVEVYAASHVEFVPFLAAVRADYSSPDTNPTTSQQPIYFELRRIIDEQLRNSGGQT